LADAIEVRVRRTMSEGRSDGILRGWRLRYRFSPCVEENGVNVG
jgi:hypothetical protein